MLLPSAVIPPRAAADCAFPGRHSYPRPPLLRFNPSSSSSSSSLSFRCSSVRIEDIAQIAHNKVLIAAGASVALGQLLKPFTSMILYGNRFDFWAVTRAGGFPSTHSSTVVAAATTLALERGFSDSIVGMAVVYAGLVMYDAQGVRREVGNHAKLLNQLPPRMQVGSFLLEDKQELCDSIAGPRSISLGSAPRSLPDEDNAAMTLKSTKASLLLESNRETERNIQCIVNRMDDVEEGAKQVSYSSKALKESIGHTEVEVLAGALLGFIVSLLIYGIL